MNPKLLFWCWALANMALVLGLAVRGVLAIRANQIEGHRRSMTWAGFFVVAFLVAYVVKRVTLGGEDLDAWSSAARVNLYVHETFVATMLIAGGFAFALGRKLARTRRVTQNANDPLAPRETISRHRLAGRIAVFAAVFGFLTACGILGGMLVRG
ncbi:MAG: DUF420 domain-containing protein [Deltaproteobacteria bacterium]|nr:DUF420 domain-containing protein [Deltaproteobacteria bacterium]